MNVSIDEDDRFQCKMDSSTRRFFVRDYTDPVSMLRAMIRSHFMKRNRNEGSKDIRCYRPIKTIEILNLGDEIPLTVAADCDVFYDVHRQRFLK